MPEIIARIIGISQKCVTFTLSLKMKWNELLKIAKEKGFILHRHGSNHDIYVHKDRPEDYLQIERHWNSEIRKGLLAKLKKQIGF